MNVRLSAKKRILKTQDKKYFPLLLAIYAICTIFIISVHDHAGLTSDNCAISAVANDLSCVHHIAPFLLVVPEGWKYKFIPKPFYYLPEIYLFQPSSRGPPSFPKV